VDLSPYVEHEQVKIRFRFTSNASAVADGWYIDDVAITGLTAFGWNSRTGGATTHTDTSPGNYRAVFRATDDQGNRDGTRSWRR